MAAYHLDSLGRPPGCCPWIVPRQKPRWSV